MLSTILERAPRLRLPETLLVAGGLSQTLWNVAIGHRPDRGIRDYDLVYFDAEDRSYEAEDRAIRAARELYADLPVPVEVRNQARVHLWYEAKHGRPYPELASSEDGLARFLTRCTALGLGPDGELHAVPGAVDDLLGFVVRPLWPGGTRDAYEAKAARWKTLWPELEVRSWAPAAFELP